MGRQYRCFYNIPALPTLVWRSLPWASGGYNFYLLRALHTTSNTYFGLFARLGLNCFTSADGFAPTKGEATTFLNVTSHGDAENAHAKRRFVPMPQDNYVGVVLGPKYYTICLHGPFGLGKPRMPTVSHLFRTDARVNESAGGHNFPQGCLQGRTGIN